jgi:hypothetical protein
VLLHAEREELSASAARCCLQCAAKQLDRSRARRVYVRGQALGKAISHPVGAIIRGHRGEHPDSLSGLGEYESRLSIFLQQTRDRREYILSGHFQATCERFAKAEGPILVLQDTSEFSCQREKPEPIGFTRTVKTGNGGYGKPETRTVCGILMHSSLAVTTEGLPLGLAAIKFWTRKKFVGRHALNKPNPTRVPIESKESIRWLENLRPSTALFEDTDRCVHIGDRESDIRVTGLNRVETRDKDGKVREAVLELKYRRIQVLPPWGKYKRYSPLSLTIIHAQERDTPDGSERIDWKP